MSVDFFPLVLVVAAGVGAVGALLAFAGSVLDADAEIRAILRQLER